jgi:RimJ/RimL family protein N-acetyltransferase
MSPAASVPADLVFRTPRLVLRPTREADAPRFVEIQSNWNVARMLRLARWPADLADMNEWVAEHRREWRQGLAYRFAIERGGQVVGCVDIDELRAGRGELGYWLDQAVWGQGLALEAARAVLDWSFAGLRLAGLDSGCAEDNPASAAILTRLGFARCGEARLWSRPRAGPITQLRFRREAPAPPAG